MVASKLNELNEHDKITDKQHIQNVNCTIKKIESNICPRCGSPLMLKKGNYGEFYGCSNYPYCNFIKKDK